MASWTKAPDDVAADTCICFSVDGCWVTDINLKEEEERKTTGKKN